MKTTLYTLVIETSSKGTFARSFRTFEAQQEGFRQWMREKDPEEAERILALPSDDQQEALDNFLHDVGGMGGEYVTEHEEEIEIPAPPKLTALARMIARLAVTEDDNETAGLDAASVRILKDMALEALSEEAQSDPAPMETLPDIASSREIGHLLEQNLITKEHLTMRPDSIHRDDRETHVYFPDGLVVSIRDAVEPSAWWA